MFELNTGLPLAFQAQPVANPLQMAMAAQQFQAQRENMLGLREQREALAADRRAQTEQRDHTNRVNTGAADAMRAGGGVRASVLKHALDNTPEAVPSLTEFFDKSDKSAADLRKLQNELKEKQLDHVGHLADGILSRGATPEALQAGLALYSEQFPDEAEDVKKLGAQLQGAAPEQIKAALERQRDAAPYWQAQQAKIAERGPTKVSPGEVVLGPDNKPVFTAPAKEQKPQSALEYEYAKTNGYKGTYEQYQNEDANRKKPVVNVSGMGGLYNQTDPQAIADAIMRGEQPPKITDLGRPVSAAVSSALAKKGYNLAAAVTDWNATQKHVASMNGAQQLRLNQAVNSLPELLDSVEELAKKWKGGKFPLLNKANLALAKNGTYGKDAASIATQLDAQIGDVNADLAVVYMGGNSPTDHGLSLASKALSTDWDERVLLDAVGRARGNVIIRRNSINNTGVAGASANNPYAPVAPNAAPAAATPAKSSGFKVTEIKQ